MTAVEKITTKYIESEDRFCITTLAADKTVQSIWLTQRLLLRLMPVILNWLDETKTTSSQLNSESQILMNDFAQHEAMSDLKKTTAISKSSESIGNRKKTLAFEVDISHSNEAISLNFKSKKGQASELVLTKKTVRQWLIIFYSQWQKSEWPTQIWPPWINNPISKPIAGLH